MLGDIQDTWGEQNVLPFMPTFVVFVLSFVSRRVSTKLPPALLRPYFPGKFVKVG